MPTVCTPKLFEFEAVEHRAAVAGSDGRDNSTRRGWMSTPEKKCINVNAGEIMHRVAGEMMHQ